MKTNVIRWSVGGADGGGLCHLQRHPHLPPVAGPRSSSGRRPGQCVRDHRGGRRPCRPTGHRQCHHHHHRPVRGAGDRGQDLPHRGGDYDITQVLGSYTATDAKDGRAVFPQWSLSGRDGGDFVIDPVTGVLAFRSTPDYDRPADSNQDNLYEVTVRGHDSRAYGNLDVMVAVTPSTRERRWSPAGPPILSGKTPPPPSTPTGHGFGPGRHHRLVHAGPTGSSSK